MALEGTVLSHPLHTLTELCARNASVELHIAAPQGEMRTARVRLLALEDNEVLVDRPDGVSRALQLFEGQRLRVYLGQGAGRLAFDTVVERRQCAVSLNARHRVPAVALRFPTELIDAQRRRDFRVSLASSGVTCTVAPVCPDYPYACALGGPRGAGLLANISARGIGLLIDDAQCLRIREGTALFLDFELPGIESPFQLLGEVRHLREVRRGGRFMVGIKFLSLPTLELSTLWRVLNRFVVEEQRRRLRRMR